MNQERLKLLDELLKKVEGAIREDTFKVLELLISRIDLLVLAIYTEDLYAVARPPRIEDLMNYG